MAIYHSLTPTPIIQPPPFPIDVACQCDVTLDGFKELVHQHGPQDRVYELGYEAVMQQRVPLLQRASEHVYVGVCLCAVYVCAIGISLSLSLILYVCLSFPLSPHCVCEAKCVYVCATHVGDRRPHKQEGREELWAVIWFKAVPCVWTQQDELDKQHICINIVFIYTTTTCFTVCAGIVE